MLTPILVNIQFYTLVVLAALFYPIGLIAALASKLFHICLPKSTLPSIKQEVALVTGAAGGLGREIAIQLAKKGCKLAIVDVNEAGAIETANYIATAYQVPSKAYKVDISNFEQVAKLKQQVTADLGQTTILVNNAGIILFENQLNPTVQEIEQIIKVNLMAHFWTKKVFLEDMKMLKRGYIVAISSAMAFCALPWFSEYASTKSGVRAMMQSLRCELQIDGYDRIHAASVFPTFLNSHKRVLDIVQNRRLIYQTPILAADKVAERIVEGMLRHEEEIVLPTALGLHFRLLNILRTKWAKLLVSLSYKLLKYNVK